jgi:hypothetical protein
MLYIENRLDARRSSMSLFLSEARKLATPGFAARVSTPGNSGGGDKVQYCRDQAPSRGPSSALAM